MEQRGKTIIEIFNGFKLEENEYLFKGENESKAIFYIKENKELLSEDFLLIINPTNSSIITHYHIFFSIIDALTFFKNVQRNKITNSKIIILSFKNSKVVANKLRDLLKNRTLIFYATQDKKIIFYPFIFELTNKCIYYKFHLHSKILQIQLKNYTENNIQLEKLSIPLLRKMYKNIFRDFKIKTILK